MVFGIFSLTIVKCKRQSNEETENQVFGNILPLLNYADNTRFRKDYERQGEAPFGHQPVNTPFPK